ncbi:hypothetical protein [Anaerocolumna chitinilytica]|uniref:Uncharacterized protein n=1 Tax=Anaerocolumna chitinilytica TaxID=1727145 RepID=A0A7I8DK58_9FIRM|nr:hypothetical protein [Anaerocolumna chitinilytica]BCJ98789.1 hypothetical protein bsdcttw_18300 [Anaerocolumna chitinilytica]
MSAFLGPIHYWVYNKITLQEEFIKDIIKASNDNNWDTELEDKLSNACGVIDNRPLEEIIDGSNIHGWLQSRISVTEGRLSFAVTTLLKEDGNRKNSLLQLAFDFGKKHAIAEDASASDAFQAINDSLIDGMPCDRVNEVLEQGDNYILWQQTTCVHARYWESLGETADIYYELRKKITEGMLSGTKLSFEEQEESVYRISEE